MPPSEGHDPAKREEPDPQKRSALEDFPEIRSPSNNRDVNRATFAYRLSELVFGSLLASYVLGFIAFAAVFIAPAITYQISPIKDAVSVSDLVKDNILSLKPFTQLFSIIPVHHGLYVNLLSKTLFSWNVLIVGQQLLISILFSAYTALLYVNFHQSILYLSTNQRKSTTDFELAIAIGISFGLSMIFPLSTIFWMGLLSLGVLRRRRRLLDEFVDHIAFKVAVAKGAKVKAGSNPGDEAENRRNLVDPIIPQVLSALQSSNHPIVRSWVGPVGKLWVAIAFMVGIPFALFAVGAVAYFTGAETDAVAQLVVKGLVCANVFFCFALFGDLLRRLMQAAHTVPSSESREDGILDHELNRLLKPLKAGP